MFFLRRNEITDVLWDLYSSWAGGARARSGPVARGVRRRKDILDALERKPPPPALGVPPDR